MTVEGASASLLGDLLADFEAELRKQRVPVDRLLVPPASPDTVGKQFAEIGLSPPDEAVTLFGWCNGIAPGLGLAFPVFESVPLDGMTRWYKTWRLGLGEWDWNPNWVQVMGGKYGLAMSCAEEPDQPPLVRSVEDSWGTQDWQTDHQVVSLCTPVTWWIDAMRRGWYTYDPSARAWDRSGASLVPLPISVYGMS